MLASVARLRDDDLIQSVEAVRSICGSFNNLKYWPCKGLLVSSSSRLRILMVFISFFLDCFVLAATVSISKPSWFAKVSALW